MRLRADILLIHLVLIHAPRAGRDRHFNLLLLVSCVSIHAPHAGRDCGCARNCGSWRVSIHAPHAGRDLLQCTPSLTLTVSIHAPHAGRDIRISIRGVPRVQFQSTRPMRGATYTGAYPSITDVFQSTRPMRGATPSISQKHTSQTFQSTRPMRGATQIYAAARALDDVSIHAPHAGRDQCGSRPRSLAWSFNPRAPCGTRRGRPDTATGSEGFQSTRPMRDATNAARALGRWRGVSIHAPHAGRDTRANVYSLARATFQSTRPMRDAT